MLTTFFTILIVTVVQSIDSSIPFDGIIRRAADGTSYAFLSPPKDGNHASFIEQITPTGTLAVAWFTGGEGTPNCSIALSLLHIGADRFTPGVIVSQRANYSNQNPVLYWDNQTTTLHLFHSSQLGNAGETNSEIWHLQSKDQGFTWSQASSFYTLPGAFDRNRIIPINNNSGLIFPCYNSSVDTDYSFVLRSSKANLSEWSRTDMTDTDDLIQPSIIRLTKSNALRAFYRDEDALSIYYADSFDDGLTWTKPKPSMLPNNNAGIQAFVLKSGAIIMAFNNHSDTKQPRSPLTVALSYDDGLTWPHQRNVQIHDDDEPSNVGEYSYPSLIQSFWTTSDDNNIHLVFTYDRQTIKYVRFNEKWIRNA